MRIEGEVKLERSNQSGLNTIFNYYLNLYYVLDNYFCHSYPDSYSHLPRTCLNK